MKFEVRKAARADSQALSILWRTLFRQSFPDLLPEEELEKWAEDRFSQNKIESQFEDERHFYFLGSLKGKDHGFSKLTIPEGEDQRIWSVSAIYVDQAFHGEGLGQALLEVLLSEARSKEVQALELDVWTKNPRAKRFYEKNGFFAMERRSIKIEAKGVRKILPHWRMALLMKGHS